MAVTLHRLSVAYADIGLRNIALELRRRLTGTEAPVAIGGSKNVVVEFDAATCELACPTDNEKGSRW